MSYPLSKLLNGWVLECRFITVSLGVERRDYGYEKQWGMIEGVTINSIMCVINSYVGHCTTHYEDT